MWKKSGQIYQIAAVMGTKILPLEEIHTYYEKARGIEKITKIEEGKGQFLMQEQWGHIFLVREDGEYLQIVSCGKKGTRLVARLNKICQESGLKDMRTYPQDFIKELGELADSFFLSSTCFRKGLELNPSLTQIMFQMYSDLD